MESLFLDETGNTGSRFWERNQPVYIEGGFIIEKRYQDKIRAKIVALEQAYPQFNVEIKGSKLVTHSKGQHFISGVLEMMGQNRSIPFIYVCEKRYCVAAKAVETFLDPAYNKHVPYSFQRDFDGKKEVAERFYAAQDELLSEFAEAFRAKNSEAMKKNVQDWVHYFESKQHFELVAQMRSFLENIDEALTQEFVRLDEMGHPGFDSLNVPVLFDLFQHIEHTIQHQCRIVHDRIASYETAYRDMFSTAKNAAPGVLATNGGTLTLPLNNIVGLDFVDSKADPLVRASDYLVAASSSYIKAVRCNADISTRLHKIGFLSLGALLMDCITTKHPHLGPSLDLYRVFASDSWLVTLVQALAKSGETVISCKRLGPPGSAVVL